MDDVDGEVAERALSLIGMASLSVSRSPAGQVIVRDAQRIANSRMGATVVWCRAQCMRAGRGGERRKRRMMWVVALDALEPYLLSS